MRESFSGGEINAKVEPRGTLGAISSDLYSVDVIGRGFRVDKIPFELHPKPGWKGRIRHLRLHLHDFFLAGLPVSRMEGEIPFAKYDLGHAFNRRRLYLRSAEAGTASVTLSAENALVFIQRKFKDTLEEGKVSLINGKIIVTGKFRFLGNLQPFYAEGRAAVREGRFADLVEPVVFLSDVLLPKSVTASIVSKLNPIIDIDTDLHLKGMFEPKNIVVGDGVARVDGVLTVPLAAPPSPTKKETADER